MDAVCAVVVVAQTNVANLTRKGMLSHPFSRVGVLCDTVEEISMARWTQTEIALLCEVYAKTPNKELGTLFGRQNDAVQAKALSLGLVKERNWSSEEKIFLKENYAIMTTNEVCHRLGRSEKSVQSQAQRMGLSQNSPYVKWIEREESLRDLEKLSYIAGLVAADGCITRNPERLALSLQESDGDTVRWIASHIVSGDYKCWQDKGKLGFHLTCPRFIAYLRSLGLTEAKSKTLRVDISSLNAFYFLRGLIDGDGSVYVGPTPSKSYISIVSASPYIFPDVCERFGGKIFQRSTGYYDLHWGGYAARELAKKLPVDDFCMTRKTPSIIQIANLIFAQETKPITGIKKQGQKFIARFQSAGKRVRLGVFNSEEEARVAYQNAKSCGGTNKCG